MPRDLESCVPERRQNKDMRRKAGVQLSEVRARLGSGTGECGHFAGALVTGQGTPVFHAPAHAHFIPQPASIAMLLHSGLAGLGVGAGHASPQQQLAGNSRAAVTRTVLTLEWVVTPGPRRASRKTTTTLACRHGLSLKLQTKTSRPLKTCLFSPSHQPPKDATEPLSESRLSFDPSATGEFPLQAEALPSPCVMSSPRTMPPSDGPTPRPSTQLGGVSKASSFTKSSQHCHSIEEHPSDILLISSANQAGRRLQPGKNSTF